VAVRDAAKFGVDEWCQSVERRLIALAPGDQEARDLPSGR
jgi:hypothetical protein